MFGSRSKDGDYMDLFMLGLLQKMSRGGGGGKSVSHSSSYTINNTVDYPIVGLNLYGKSTQNGTPTPEAPIDIVSVGDGGSVEVQTCGKNLFPWNDYSKSPLYFWSTDSSVKGVKNTDVIEFTLNSNQERFGGLTLSSKDFNDIMKNYNGKTIVLSWEMKADNTDIAAPMACGWQRRYDRYTPTTSWAKYTNIFKVNTEYTNNYLTWYGKSNSTTTIFIRNIQIEIGDTATDYEPYKGTTASITSALPLCGIPVESGGNYTDSNGQQWICDELVYNADGTGKIIKRINEIIFNGSEDWKLSGNGKSAFLILSDDIKVKYKNNWDNAEMFSNKYVAGSYNNYYHATKTCISTAGNGAIVLYDERFVGNIEALKADMVSNNLRVVYALATPQEIELTSKEMTALRQLQTFDGITNISNSDNADMDVKYCTDKSLSECVLPITMGLQKQIDELQVYVQKQIDEIEAGILTPGILIIPGSYAETIIGPIITEGDE